MDEPCKIMRKKLAERIESWGEVEDWKREPNCGCKSECKRLKTMRDNENWVRLNANTKDR